MTLQQLLPDIHLVFWSPSEVPYPEGSTELSDALQILDINMRFSR